MILYEDTRQQFRKHDNVQDYCRRKGITIVRRCLDVGDYMIHGNDHVSVDTKESVVELAKNISSRDHARFQRECIRARDKGIQLYVLIEETLPGGLLDNWVSPTFKTYGRFHRPGDPICLVNPLQLKAAMKTMTHKYGVKFRFCDARSTGRVMLELLTGVRK